MTIYLAQLFALDIFNIEITPGSIALFLVAIVSPLVLLLLVALDTEMRSKGLAEGLKGVRSAYGTRTTLGIGLIALSLVLMLVVFVASL